MAQSLDAPLPKLLGSLDITIGGNTFENVLVYCVSFSGMGDTDSGLYQVYEWTAKADLGGGLEVFYYGNNTSDPNCYDYAVGGNPFASMRSLLGTSPA